MYKSLLQSHCFAIWTKHPKASLKAIELARGFGIEFCLERWGAVRRRRPKKLLKKLKKRGKELHEHVLVGVLEHEFCFSIAIGKYWECHYPNWLIDIFRGAQPPSSGDMIRQAQSHRGVGPRQLGARVWHLGVGLFKESKFDQRTRFKSYYLLLLIII